MAPVDTKFPGTLERSLTKCFSDTDNPSCVSSIDLPFVRAAVMSQSSTLRENVGKMTEDLNAWGSEDKWRLDTTVEKIQASEYRFTFSITYRQLRTGIRDRWHESTTLTVKIKDGVWVAEEDLAQQEGSGST